MNIKSIVTTLVFLLISVTGFSQSKYIQKLGSLATIEFPDTPKIIERDGAKQYILHHNLGYAAIVSDVKGGLRDLFVSSNRDSLYSTFLKSMLASSKGKLLYRDKIKINGHDGIQFGVTSKVKDQQIYGYYRSVTLNDTLIVCGILSSDLVPTSNKNIASYFNNFKVISAAELSDINTTKAAYNTGRIVAKLLVVLLFVDIGFGIVSLIKKIAYKKEKS